MLRRERDEKGKRKEVEVEGSTECRTRIQEVQRMHGMHIDYRKSRRRIREAAHAGSPQDEGRQVAGNSCSSSMYTENDGGNEGVWRASLSEMDYMI